MSMYEGWLPASGTHLTRQKLREFGRSLYPGSHITGRYIQNMDASAGIITPALDNMRHPAVGAVIPRHDFVVRRVYRNLAELETIDKGEKWLCYVNLKELYIQRERLLIYSIRKAES